MPLANLNLKEMQRIVEALKQENTNMEVSSRILEDLSIGTAEFKEKRRIKVAKKTEANTIIIRKLEALHNHAMESRVFNEALSIINQSKNRPR